MKLLGLSLIATAVLFTACSTKDAHHEEAHAHHGVHWGYDGEVSPKHWGDLKPEYLLCKSGTKQSPINIDTEKTVNLKEEHKISLAHKKSDAEVVNNGHTIQVNPKDGGKISINGKEYKLLQFHFHSHSEHTVDGKQYDMVAHLVHKSDDGELAVIGVLMQEDNSRNETIGQIWHNMPHDAEHKNGLGEINVASLLPSDTSKYYHYVGSLTTPNCAEDVQWYVMKEPIKLSHKQIEKFRELYSHNFRPTNPLNGRVVEESK